MKGEIVFGILFGILLLSFVSAENVTFKQMECKNIIGYKSEIIGKEIPEKVPFSNEIFNIYISEENYGFLEIAESKIKEFDCFENKNATYDILIESEETLFDIYESEDVASTIIEKMDNKEIELKGKSFGTKIKAFFVKVGVKWFG